MPARLLVSAFFLAHRPKVELRPAVRRVDLPGPFEVLTRFKKPTKRQKCLVSLL
jgi:hypothetical protein